jgi:hypothetical protein
MVSLTKQKPKEQVAYQRYLVDKRLEDFRNTLRGTNDNDRLSASLRYAATAGDLTALLQRYNLSDEKKLTLQQFSRHREILKHEEASYLGHDKKYLEDAIHYLEQYTAELR